jgi:hypothetical protein
MVVLSQGNKGVAPVVMIGLPMPADKSIPTSISVAMELMDDDPDSRDTTLSYHCDFHVINRHSYLI